MRFCYRCLLTICFLSFIISLASAYTSSSDGSLELMESYLVNNDYSNVSIIHYNGHLIVTYENRIYRNEAKALKELARLLFPIAKDNESITLIPQNRGIPIVAVNITDSKSLPYLNGITSNEDLSHFAEDRKSEILSASFDLDSLQRQISKIRRLNPSFRKLNVIIYPQIQMMLGNFNDPVEYQLNLAPEISTTLRKGMTISAQLIIPIQNELDEKGNHLRPGLITANQTFRIPRNIFISTNLGYFTLNRYGIELEIRKFFANGEWSVGMNTGYTGYASYARGSWKYSKLNLLTDSFDVGYRFPKLDLMVNVIYGKFLYGDKGFRFDVLRQFGEINIGFFAIKTGKGNNAGFNISVPIFPPKYKFAGSIRVSPAKEFSMEYRYKGDPNNGIKCDTGLNINSIVREYNPDYLEKQIIKDQCQANVSQPSIDFSDPGFSIFMELVSMPTATIPKDREVYLGLKLLNRHYISGPYRNVLTRSIIIGYLPFLEVGAGLTDDLNLSNQALGDRMLSLKLGIHRESNHVPSIAIGVRDPIGTKLFNASYLVLSKSFVVSNAMKIGNPRSLKFGLTLGYGVDWIKSSRHEFTGIFGGISFTHIPAVYMIEYDTKKFNCAVRVSITESMQLLFAIMDLSTFKISDFRSFSGGVFYKFRL